MIIDVHQHVGSLAGYASVRRNASVERNDVSIRRETNARFGISHAVIQPAFEYSASEASLSIRKLNDAMARYAAENDFVVAALGVVDLFAMEDPRSEAERAISELGLAGIAWHTRFQRAPTNALSVMDVIEACPSTTRLVGVHCVAESTLEAPWRLETLLAAFPTRSFLALSSLTGPSQCAEMIELCRRRPNLYLETAGLYPLGLWIERFIDQVGPDRLMFGTDLYLDPPLFRHNYAQQAVEAAHISDAAREAIYYANAARVLCLTDRI